MWLRITLIIIFSLLTLIVVLLIAGAIRWNSRTDALFARLDAARASIKPAKVDFRELDNLPAPVQRYFRTALKDGAPIISTVAVDHIGTFNMGQSDDQWKAFTSTQHVTTKQPGFVWNARIAMMAGLSVRVHDAYVAGEGMLNPAIAGLFSLTDMRGTGEIAKGQLMRYFAEAVWYPTALLPSQGVLWEAIDARSAKATMTDYGHSITLTFRFGEDGLIESGRAEARGRTVGDKVIPTPWEGRFFNYEKRQEMMVPMDGEVAWVLPEKKKLYWRGHIQKIKFEYPDSPIAS